MRTMWVALITSAMMLTELFVGYRTSSLALTADGWHMASHLGALVIALSTYHLSFSHSFNEQFSFGSGKLIPLGGYSSALILGVIGVLIAVDSIDRLLHPQAVNFGDAILVAVVGLIVNFVCIAILHDHESTHVHGHVHDHSLRSTYLHIVADSATSVLAIVALTIARFTGQVWLDAAMGFVSSLVIVRWAYSLCRVTGSELLDGHAEDVDRDEVKKWVDSLSAKLVDLHIWRIAPRAVACEIVVVTEVARGPYFYRKILRERFGIAHAVIEERVGEAR
jgi:cation diffusion facilitator family transporter